MTVVRNVLGALFIAAALLIAVWAGSVISTLFRDSYRDSPGATYLVVGGLGFAISGLLVWAALLTFRPLRRGDRH
jgi:drug/metabolite transporter (DMT)-like permease